MRNLIEELGNRLGMLFDHGNLTPKENKQRYVDRYKYFALLDKEVVLTEMKSHLEGLDQETVTERLGVVGPNELITEQKVGILASIFDALWNPFNLLLGSIAIVSHFTGDIVGTSIVLIMIFLSGVLTFIQEARSNKAAEKLKAMVTMTCTVLRRSKGDLEDEPEEDKLLRNFQELPISQIVPGDIVKLSAGDMIPADLRILKSKDLFTSQSALTGEAMPVEKHASIEDSSKIMNLLEITNICYMGSSVITGTATGVVLNTGVHTYFGSVAKGISKRKVMTNFDKGIRKFSWLMLALMTVMAPLVFLINGFLKGDWPSAFMFALSVAVGLTPEMLPMIVTVNLAAGARRMAKKHVIVKRLNSIQNFGAMNILCTDKTGTLTQDKVILLKCIDPRGEEDTFNIMQFAYLNSYYQTGLKNLLDHAVLDYVKEDHSRKPKSKYRKVDEIPFDFQRRRMSVIVEEDGVKDILICKGALEEILSISVSAEVQGEEYPLSDELKKNMVKLATDLSEDGLRVIALAYKEISKDHKSYAIKDESQLTLLGFLAFLDPPKESAAKAIEGLNRYGVKVKVLTGDNDFVTRKICKEVGLNADDIILGHEINAMSDAQLSELTERSYVFAKLTPMQKQRIIKAMRAKGHVVGFLGDGINDAPALKEADVGISVDNAVDMAKESADIILLEKNLLVLEEGVIEGRWVFGNILKYLRMGASSNFGNVFTMVGASLILPFLPILPIQLLIQNLLYDFSQTGIPFDKVDDSFLKEPKKWDLSDISRYMFYLGPVSSLFDYITFAVLWFVFKANTLDQQSLFQSAWFVESLITQTLVVHMLRTKKIPFFQSSSSPALALTTTLVIALAIYFPYAPFAGKMGMVPLPHSFFYWLFPLTLAYMLCAQFIKSRIIGRIDSIA